MKSIVLAAVLILASTAVSAETNVYDQMKACTFYSVKATQYATIASGLNDSDVDQFKAIVQAEIDSVPLVDAKKTLIFLGTIAWNNRREAPVDVGMAVYADCVEGLGTKT